MNYFIDPLMHFPIPRKIYWLFFVGCFMLLPGNMAAQPIDMSRVVARGQIGCDEIALSMTELIPVYHRDNQTDTLHAALAYWQEQCGGPEPMVRFQILYQIEANTFTDEWYPDNILDLLRDYRGMVTSNMDQPFYYDYFAGDYFPLHPEFSEFTTNLARYLHRYTDLRPTELFFLDFYARDFDKAMQRLEAGHLEGSRIHQMFQAEQELIRNKRHRYLGVYGGTWRPNQNLAILGSKAQVGFFLGSVRNRLVTDFSFVIGFLNTPEEYHVVHDNVLYATNSYMGVHLGFDIGTKLVKTASSALIPTIGIGMEGFEAFSAYDQERYGLSKVVGSMNLNVGLAYRIMTTHSNYVGLQAKYHFINYRNKGGTDLSGNAATFGITIGFAYE